MQSLKFEGLLIYLGMGNSQICVTEIFSVFRLFKGFTKIWEGSNILKLYSVEVCFYQNYKFVILGENKMIVLKQ